MIINIDVLGIPVSKARPRFSIHGGHVHAYTPKGTSMWEHQIRMTAQKIQGKDAPLQEAILMAIEVRLPVPKSLSKKKKFMALSGSLKPIKRPDLDNYVKAALDALQGVVFRDDSQICEIRAKKTYSETPGMNIIIST